MGSACIYRSRVDSARAHVYARMYAYTYERFYKYQIRRSIQHRRCSPAVTVPAHRPSLLLGSQVRTHPPAVASPRLAAAAAAAARSLSNTAYDIINTIHDFCFIFTCVFNILYYLYLYYLYYFTLDNRCYMR